MRKAQEVHQRMREGLPQMPMVLAISEAKKESEKAGKDLNDYIELMSRQRTFLDMCSVCRVWR